ncbi:Endoglin [Aix galericulata]|nr:Endoglin [Aix galericulata]
MATATSKRGRLGASNTFFLPSGFPLAAAGPRSPAGPVWGSRCHRRPPASHLGAISTPGLPSFRQHRGEGCGGAAFRGSHAGALARGGAARGQRVFPDRIRGPLGDRCAGQSQGWGRRRQLVPAEGCDLRPVAAEPPVTLSYSTSTVPRGCVSSSSLHSANEVHVLGVQWSKVSQRHPARRPQAPSGCSGWGFPCPAPSPVLFQPPRVNAAPSPPARCAQRGAVESISSKSGAVRGTRLTFSTVQLPRTAALPLRAEAAVSLCPQRGSFSPLKATILTLPRHRGDCPHNPHIPRGGGSAGSSSGAEPSTHGDGAEEGRRDAGRLEALTALAAERQPPEFHCLPRGDNRAGRSGWLWGGAGHSGAASRGCVPTWCGPESTGRAGGGSWGGKTPLSAFGGAGQGRRRGSRFGGSFCSAPRPRRPGTASPHTALTGNLALTQAGACG